MAAGLSVDHDVVRWMQSRLEAASSELLREMVKTFAEGRRGRRVVQRRLPAAHRGAGQIAVGVNRDGHREVLGVDATPAEDGAGWLAFWGSVSRFV